MNLIDRLPHKPPALLIANAVKVGENGAECPLLSAPDASLAPNGLLPATLGLEAIAQTAALWMCWRYEAKPVKGMLVQCRNFTMLRRFLPVTEGLVAMASPLSVGSVTGLYLFSGAIRNPSGETLARGEFMIFAKDGE